MPKGSAQTTAPPPLFVCHIRNHRSLKMVHDPENRKSPRYNSNFTGYLQIMCPELTFTPRPIYVQAVDVSRTGCRLITKSINADFYKLLIVEVRHVKLELDLQDGRMVTLRGRLVWVDYRERHASLGIYFHGLSQRAEDELIKLLGELQGVGAINEVDCSRPDTTTQGVTH